MDTHQQNTSVYEPENPTASSSELFNGRTPLEEALNKLRTRLLDLSTRNLERDKYSSTSGKERTAAT
jgi:hypothetical protein